MPFEAEGAQRETTAAISPPRTGGPLCAGCRGILQGTAEFGAPYGLLHLTPDEDR
ncbi:hypothetical protein [Peterkaempfera sp. SMS 1(5)a]|uniref:hypothetical protein n=1 Tax=Peterkaempfera podocarpi TaxID=3232308 RepID=UPI00366ED290